MFATVGISVGLYIISAHSYISPIVRPGSRTPGNPAQIPAEEESRPEKLNVPIIIAMAV